MIKSPVLIIGCARSGTTLIYNMLSGSPSLWSIGFESKSIIERYHHPSVKGWESGELSAADLAVFPGIMLLRRALEKREAGELRSRFLPMETTYPALARWIGRVENLPGYDRTYPPHWREGAPRG